MLGKKVFTEICCSLAVMIASAFAAFWPIPPADLWWQLAVGRYITQTGDVLRQNIFSYTASTFPILDHEWLCELLFFKLYQLGGLSLLYVFKSIVIGLVFLIFYRLCLRRGLEPVLSAMSVILCAFFANLALFGDVRPYLFTYLFLAVLLYVLYSFSMGNRKTVWILLPSLLVWLNCHGGYMLFFALIIIYFLSDLVSELLNRNKENKLPSGIKIVFSREFLFDFWLRNKQLVLVFFCGILLLFINPYGAKLILYPFSFSSDSFYKANLIEWVKPDLLGKNLNFLIFYVIFLVLTLISRRKVFVFDWLLLFSFSYLVFSAVRHITIFAMALSPLFAVIVCNFFYIVFKRIKNGGYSYLQPVLSMSLFLTFFLILIFKVNSFTITKLSMERTHFPYNGIKFIEMNNLPGNIYHPYGWGGYLIWNLYPLNHEAYRVFIDGRANVAYPEEIFRESIVLDFGAEGWQEYMERYNINVALCSKYHMRNVYKGSNLVSRISESGKWTLVYEDRAEYVFIRINDTNTALLEKALKGELKYPESSFRNSLTASSLISEDKLKEALELLARTVYLDETDPVPPFLMASVFFKLSDFDSCKIMIDESLRRDHSFVGSWELLSRLYILKGNNSDAEKALKKAKM